MTAHFGHWITLVGSRKRIWQLAGDFIYGQVKKRQRRRRLIKVELQMLWGGWNLRRAAAETPPALKSLIGAVAHRRARCGGTTAGAIYPPERGHHAALLLILLAQTVFGFRVGVESWRLLFNWQRLMVVLAPVHVLDY